MWAMWQNERRRAKLSVRGQAWGPRIPLFLTSLFNIHRKMLNKSDSSPFPTLPSHLPLDP